MMIRLLEVGSLAECLIRLGWQIFEVRGVFGSCVATKHYPYSMYIVPGSRYQPPLPTQQGDHVSRNWGVQSSDTAAGERKSTLGDWSEHSSTGPRLWMCWWAGPAHVSPAVSSCGFMKDTSLPLLCRKSARESGSSCISSTCMYRSSVWERGPVIYGTAHILDSKYRDLFALPKHTQHDHASGRLHLLSFFWNTLPSKSVSFVFLLTCHLIGRPSLATQYEVAGHGPYLQRRPPYPAVFFSVVYVTAWLLFLYLQLSPSVRLIPGQRFIWATEDFLQCLKNHLPRDKPSKWFLRWMTK